MAIFGGKKKQNEALSLEQIDAQDAQETAREDRALSELRDQVATALAKAEESGTPADISAWHVAKATVEATEQIYATRRNQRAAEREISRRATLDAEAASHIAKIHASARQIDETYSSAVEKLQPILATLEKAEVAGTAARDAARGLVLVGISYVPELAKKFAEETATKSKSLGVHVAAQTFAASPNAEKLHRLIDAVCAPRISLSVAEEKALEKLLEGSRAMRRGEANRAEFTQRKAAFQSLHGAPTDDDSETRLAKERESVR